MAKELNINSIPKEKFDLANLGDHIKDQKFEDKPVGYFKDAWRRFCKNKASIAAAIVIILIVAAIITPTTDVMTLMLVTLPIYLLYEISILAVKMINK